MALLLVQAAPPGVVFTKPFKPVLPWSRSRNSGTPLQSRQLLEQFLCLEVFWKVYLGKKVSSILCQVGVTLSVGSPAIFFPDPDLVF